jgi:hypothetical protein
MDDQSDKIVLLSRKCFQLNWSSVKLVKLWVWRFPDRWDKLVLMILSETMATNQV